MGGQNWTLINTINSPQQLNYIPSLNAYLSTGHGLSYSTDNGLTWTTQPSFTNVFHDGVGYTPSGKIFITTKDYVYTSDKLLAPTQFDPNDVAVLKTIRDNAPADSPLKTEWADESKIGTWVGVTWNILSPKKLVELSVASKKLTSLNVSGLDSLQYLYCPDNLLISIDLSGLTKLRTIFCHNNKLTSFKASGLTNLLNLYCQNNQITSLDASDCVNLQVLSCPYNLITALNLNGLSNLKEVLCFNNQLSSLELSGLTNLRMLNCQNNQLISLNITDSLNIQYLICLNNQISSLNVTRLTNLKYLDCSVNQLVSLDLSGLINLNKLNCFVNQLTTLNVSGLTNLKELSCGQNHLTSLNVLELTNLSFLSCGENLLTSMNASELKLITTLITYGNKIPFSQLPLPKASYTLGYYYTPQNKVFEEKAITLGQGIDYSSESTIDGTATVFSWFKYDVLIVGTDQSGKYSPTESGDFHCEMTNAKFPGLVLTTNMVTVKNATTDVNPSLTSSLKIYPNPNTGKFTISGNGDIDSFEIYNIDGERIFSSSGMKQQTLKEFDLSNFSKGIYLIKIDIGNHSYSRKIVIQ